MALLVSASIAALVTVGLDARSTEAIDQGRGLCRLQSRWAAESAVVRIEAQLLRAGARSHLRVDGTLTTTPNTAEYRAEGSRSGGKVSIEAVGSCNRSQRHQTIVTRLEVDLEQTPKGQWVRTRWLEQGRKQN
ncbi:MAG: hypothetical protein H6729_16050 [Deltaproteobacteria bacterium]|nr:hypothetical protein [Deltaproteobacteria bacterium]